MLSGTDLVSSPRRYLALNIMASRREKIQAMLIEEPGDTFLRYSLAMELDKEGDHETSLAELRELYSLTPPYIPAFFMAGQQLAKLNRLDESRSVLRTGVEQAQIQGDSHAASEMTEFMAALSSSGE